MKYFFDTEFVEDGHTIDLISIGIVSENGKKYYAESSEWNRSKTPTWVQENVVAKLCGPVITRKLMASDIIEFCGFQPEIWAYYGAYDWVALCQLFGSMMNLPQGWPMFCMDVKQLCVMKGNPKLPEQITPEHHALNDAQWCREAWKFLQDK